MSSAMVSRDGKRRCDESCHEARSPKPECRCMCGGRYHGVGSKAIPMVARDMRSGVLAPEHMSAIERARRDPKFRAALFAESAAQLRERQLGGAR